jgi:hypothetical protein
MKGEKSMLNWLDSNISIETLIWLFPITFLIHDFEEIIFVEAWFKKNYERILPRIPNGMKEIFQDLASTTSARFSIPVFLQFIVYVFASFIAVEQQTYGLLLGVNVILFLHVFMHIGQSLYVKVYALGVGSAILVTLPYSIYLFYRLINEGLISGSDLVINAPYGILTIVLVLGGHKLAHKILPN